MRPDLANEQLDMTKTTPVAPHNYDTKSRACFVLHVLVYAAMLLWHFQNALFIKVTTDNIKTPLNLCYLHVTFK